MGRKGGTSVCTLRSMCRAVFVVCDFCHMRTVPETAGSEAALPKNGLRGSQWYLYTRLDKDGQSSLLKHTEGFHKVCTGAC